MRITDLGTIDFQEAFAIQERLVAGVAAGTEQETLLLLEHPPVYTIGSGGNEANVLDGAIAPVRINRGGDVTWHGPGQLVGYPLVNLDGRRRDLHRYLRFLEELLIAVAADFRVESWRIPGRTGIWTNNYRPEPILGAYQGGEEPATQAYMTIRRGVGDEANAERCSKAAPAKLASIGVGVRRWVTMHGFALNVTADLSAFDRINPCGIEGCPVTSLAREAGLAVTMAEAKGRIGERFEGLLGEWLPVINPG